MNSALKDFCSRVASLGVRLFAMDGNKWITVKPNGERRRGQPVLVNEQGVVQGGMGGKFNGKHISEAKGEGKKKKEIYGKPYANQKKPKTAKTPKVEQKPFDADKAVKEANAEQKKNEADLKEKAGQAQAVQPAGAEPSTTANAQNISEDPWLKETVTKTFEAKGFSGKQLEKAVKHQLFYADVIQSLQKEGWKGTHKEVNGVPLEISFQPTDAPMGYYQVIAKNPFPGITQGKSVGVEGLLIKEGDTPQNHLGLIKNIEHHLSEKVIKQHEKLEKTKAKEASTKTESSKPAETKKSTKKTAEPPQIPEGGVNNPFLKGKADQKKWLPVEELNKQSNQKPLWNKGATTSSPLTDVQIEKVSALLQKAKQQEAEYREKFGKNSTPENQRAFEAAINKVNLLSGLITNGLHGKDSVTNDPNMHTQKHKACQNAKDLSKPTQGAFMFWSTNNGYIPINAYLRENKKETEVNGIKRVFNDDHEKAIARMEKAFKDAKRTDKNFITYRTMHAGEKWKWFDDLQRGKLKVGDVVPPDPGYFATTSKLGDTTDHFMNGGGSGIMLKLTVPKGSKAISIKDVSSFEAENEILLPRNTQFRIASVEVDEKGPVGKKKRTVIVNGILEPN